MTLLKAPTVELDADWTYVGEIVKAEKLANGTRRIIGVASGIEEDRDGERMSKRAIAKMVTEGQSLARKGNLPLTSAHTPDWVSSFGKVVALERDPDTHQLVIDTHLPAEGADPIADKAWRAHTVEGKKLGFSVGGKLRKAFHEIDADTGKRRRVLDDVAINHVMLTEHPSYDRSFSLAVAKSFTGEPPAREAFTEPVDLEAEYREAADIVAKAKAAPPAPAPAKPDDDQPDPDAAPGTQTPPADDQATQANAAAADEPSKTPGEPSDAEEAQGLPMARHLACPNCGHEFAADLPNDPSLDAGDTDNDTDDGADKSTTEKTHQEPTQMSDTDVLARIRELVEGTAVAKATPPEPAAVGDDVLKQVQTIAQGLVKTHEHSEARISDLEAGVKTGFEGVAKTLKALTDAITNRPQGRKSVARILQPHGEDPAVNKSTTEADEEVELEEAVSKAASAQDAMAEMNKRHPRYAHLYAD